MLKPYNEFHGEIAPIIADLEAIGALEGDINLFKYLAYGASSRAEIPPDVDWWAYLNDLRVTGEQVKAAITPQVFDTGHRIGNTTGSWCLAYLGVFSLVAYVEDVMPTLEDILMGHRMLTGEEMNLALEDVYSSLISWASMPTLPNEDI